MSEALQVWVATELDKRNWSHREFARQSGLSHSFVSKVIAGKTPPNSEFCVKTAITLGVTPETVLKLANILPPDPPASPTDSATLQTLVELARTLPPDQQEQLLAYCRFLIGQSR